MEATIKRILVAGAGIIGLWQAVTLARAGHSVRLIERSSELFADTSSALAGAMVAPYCESEAAERIVTELGAQSFDLWQAVHPGMKRNGSLVVAAPSSVTIRSAASLSQ